jgi:inosine-uridine nucleoside N-ribohydrolase
MKRFLALALLLLLASYSGAHDEATPVIIDTDAALDDLRAITLLLANDHIEALAITASEGACSVPRGCGKVGSLLLQLGMEKIPVGAGNRIAIDTPPWRVFAEGIRWGEEAGTETEYEPAASVVKRVLSAQKNGIVYIALGSLDTLAHLLESGAVRREQINAVIWYNDSADPLNGTNYSYNPEAAEAVLRSGIPVKIVGGGSSSPLITEEMLAGAGEYLNPFAKAILKAHDSEAVQNRIKEKHLRGWDDQIAVWYNSPELFDCESLEEYESVSFCRLKDLVGFYRAFLEILENAGGRRKHVVLRKFPAVPEQYTDDLVPFVEDIIERHGEEEFRIVVMTNELHRHLGIYSIVGAKMGLRARELLGAGMDELNVRTLCGLEPPISCMNDGIQVSTGATLGQGLIEVMAEKRVAAEFRRGDESVTLELKPQYIEQVRSDIRRCIDDYGYLTPVYWLNVRKLAIRYWREWDRAVIFIEK